MSEQGKAHGGIGHNVRGATIAVEARLFNSLTGFAPPGRARQTVHLPAGSTVGDLMRVLGLPAHEVFLVLRNGRDVTRSLHGPVNTEAVLDHGDVVAFSGPVPYSWGYGAPVV